VSAPGGLALARCELHAEREAAVRCLECGRDYCRECVADHQGRLLCRSCLARRAEERPAAARRGAARRLGALAAVATGFLVAWVAFYSLGRLLLLLPTGVESAAEAGAEAE
jgi:hypothetical protein